MTEKSPPFLTDREKRLAFFAQEVLEMALTGLDVESSDLVDAAEEAGLVCWEDCTAENQDDWPDDCEAGDPMWKVKRDQLPWPSVKLECVPTTEGAKMQLLALQKLQRTVYQAIEQTRQQLAERGGPL